MRVLREDSNNTAALYSLAAICANASRLGEALRHIGRATLVNPNFPQALLAKSIILLRLGRASEALEAVDRAISIDPSLPGAVEQQESLKRFLAQAQQIPQFSEGGLTPSADQEALKRALALQSSGQIVEATAAFEAILARNPNEFAALYSMGLIEHQNGNSKSALSYLERALNSEPAQPIGHYALGTILQGLGLFEEALASFDAALALNPNYKEVYTNKSRLLHSMNRQPEALTTLKAALEIFPHDKGLLNNIGYVLTEFKLYPQAAHYFKRLVDIDPLHEGAQGLHAYARLHACDWTDYEKNRSQILQAIEDDHRVCNPLALMAFTDDARLLQKCAVEFGKSRFPASSSSLWKGETYRHRRKRVAFLSADFREHPVGYLLIELIENLPKLGYETVGISLGICDNSILYKRYRQAFTHYLDCQDKLGSEVASILRAFEVDIAVDLAGYTAGTRLEILAQRPCPIQATYLGFPGTLGLPYVDYLIADYFIVPPEHEPFYSEKILKLPHSYLPRDSSVTASETTPSKATFGLPEEGLVFGSFNHDYKINPPLFDVWMRLLRENPGSVLWLMQLNDFAQANLQREAQHRGVDSSRLVFATRVPKVEDHLARYRHIDLFLDTFPYGGHTTASDALLTGTRLVTNAGGSFASRVAGCMLTDLGHPDQIANSLDEYYEIACKMIHSRPERGSPNPFPGPDKLAEAFSACIEQMSPDQQ